MITFPFPPMVGSSGVQRPLNFVRDLPAFGWEPIVLSAHARAYPQTGDEQLKDIPDSTVVKRAAALDVSRVFGKIGYPSFLARPDRWASWSLGGWLAGLALLKRHKPDLIWSTYPIASAHLIGMRLQKASQLPWIADFRDPMVEADYPADTAQRASYLRIEQSTVQQAARCVFVAPGTRRLYEQRYGQSLADKACVISNGYDDKALAAISEMTATPRNAPLNRITLLHSGVIYPSERDPRQFFAALGELLREGRLSSTDVHVVLRAPGNEKFLRELITQHKIAPLVSLEPPIAHRAALAEMFSADALLVLQASNCNNQVPAKLYEYFATRKPILGLTDPAGDTAASLRGAGIDTIANLHDKEAIKHILVQYLQMLRNKIAPCAEERVILAETRRNKSADLARLFDETA